VILERLDLTPTELLERTGWELKPEGACKDERCVPLPELTADADGRVDITPIADRLRMPIAHDSKHGLWALGPESGGKVLDGTALPDIVLPDFDGNAFDVATLRGRKVLLVAWASW
jgi:hypothetical protein